MKHLHSLSRKMTLIMAIKLIALVSLYYVFFSASHHVQVDPAQVEGRFYSNTGVTESGE